MGLKITLAGVDITSTCDEMSLKITDTLGQGAGVGGGSAGRASTCEFLTTLGPAASAVGAGTNVTSPTLVRQGEVVVYDTNSNKIFGGFLGKISDKTELTRVYTLCDCYDYYQELDRYQVQKTYSGASDVFMLRDLLTTYAPWVDQSALPSTSSATYNFTVKVFKATTLQKCISMITDITGYQFWIDPYKKAHYVSPTQGSSSPFSLSSAPDFSQSFPHGVDSYETDDNSAINRVTFYGGKIPSADFTQDLTTQANGTNKTFVLAYYPRYATDGKIHVQATSIASGDLVLGYTLGTGNQNKLKSAGGTCDVLLNADAHTLTFDVAPTNTSGNTVTCKYRYEYPLVVQITDQKSYSFYGKYFDGVISDDTIFDPATAVGRCRTLIIEQAYGLTTIKLHCWKPGIQSGQVLSIYNQVRGINNAYIVQEVDTVPLGNGQFVYNITVGAWNWNLVDVILQTAHAAFTAGVSTSVTDPNSSNTLNLSQFYENAHVHDAWTKSTKAAGGPFYARSTPVGDGHDAYPGLCTA